MKGLAAIAIFVSLMAFVSAQTPCYPCDPAWPRPVYYPNFEDCTVLWECSGGALTQTACDAPYVFDFLLQACVPDSPEMLYTCNKLLGRDCAPQTTIP